MDNKNDIIEELSEGKGCVVSIIIILILFVALGVWLFC